MLSISGVHTFYGNIEALRGVDIDVAPGEIVTLIGANGAGKSTLLMTICGSPRARHGRVHVRGPGHHSTCRPTRSCACGIAQAPGRAAHLPAHDRAREPADGRDHRRAGPFRGGSRHASSRSFPILKQRQGQRGGTLSGGEQQMLAIGRALMSRPRLLLARRALARPRADDREADLRRHPRDQPERRVTVFLVEQNAYHALKLAHRGYVMVNGRITLSGTGRELLANAEVRAAYLEGGHTREPVGA